MPHRNLITIVLVAVLSLACYSRVDQGHYAAKLRQIMNYIHDDGLYETNRREMFEAAATAMAATVGDPNTMFEPKDEKEDINKQLSQEFGGIGAVLQLVNQRPHIAHVLLDGPAATAGLRPGDTVLSVDGTDTLQFAGDLREFTHAVTGEAGTRVTLTVERDGSAAPLEFTITREKVFIDSIKGYVRAADGTWDYAIPWAPNIAYLRIEGSFGAKTYSELVAALRIIHEKQFAGLVIDLRNNPGGLLEAAHQICNLFLPANQIIVTTRDREGNIQKAFESDGSGPYQKIPLAVLINKGSASASEIVAGCLKDLHRAVVVGERSFGKGTVQQLFDVDGGRSMLRLSTAKWCTASNRTIHRTKKNGGTDRETADESSEWGILPSEGDKVVIDNQQIGQLLRHFDKLAWAAIDKVYSPPESKAVEVKKDKKNQKVAAGNAKPPSESQQQDARTTQDKKKRVGGTGSAGSAVEPKGGKKASASDEKAAEKEPFVDIQLERAVQAVEKFIDDAPQRQAA